MVTMLVDYNNISMMKAFHKEVQLESDCPNYTMWEFLVFETIYDYIRKFKNITNVVIAKDNKKYWRRSYFPRYKETRIKQKKEEKRNIDWSEFMKYLNSFHKELGQNFPFKCLDITYCEADDIIGHLSLTLDDDIIILSSDSDFKQVLKKGVRAYSPYTLKFLTCSNTKKFLLETCLKGQAKDSIFNVITPEDYPSELRKPGFGDVKCNKWIDSGLDLMLIKKIKYNKGNYKRSVLPLDRFKRNNILMDFKLIPDTIKQVIEKRYNEYKIPEMKNIYEYFSNKKWRRFIEEYEMTENKLLTLY